MFTQKFHIPRIIAQERPGAPENQKIQYQTPGFQSFCLPGAWRGHRPSVLSGVIALHWFPSKAHGLRRRVAKASTGPREAAQPWNLGAGRAGRGPLPSLLDSASPSPSGDA